MTDMEQVNILKLQEIRREAALVPSLLPKVNEL